MKTFVRAGEATLLPRLLINVKGETITGLHVHVHKQKEHRDLLFPISSPLCINSVS